MKRWFFMAWIGLILVGWGLAQADERGSAAQAKLLVDKAADFVKAQGKEKAIAEFNNLKGQFVKGDLYVYAWDLSGNVLAIAPNPKMVGTNVLNKPDEDGKYFRKEAIELAKAKGSGWVDYKYKHPKTGKLEQKTSYVKKVEDMVLGCGAYK